MNRIIKIILLHFFIIVLPDKQNDWKTIIDACPNVNNKKKMEGVALCASTVTSGGAASGRVPKMLPCAEVCSGREPKA
jgi:hypothetical protein